MSGEGLLQWFKGAVGGFNRLPEIAARVACLPGLAEWTPPRIEYNTTAAVATLGVTLARIDHPSFQPLLAAISDSLRRTGLIEHGLTAELTTAALIRPWVDTVTYVARVEGKRTPDLIATAGLHTVEIEVTTADRKAEQDELSRAAAGVQKKLLAAINGRRISAYFLDRLEEHEAASLIEAACSIEVGGTAQKEGRWFITALPAPKEPTLVIENHAPDWWPPQVATGAMAAFGADIRDGKSTGQYVCAEIRYCLSLRSYMNPLSKKADRFQGSGIAPFVIAIDVTRLPGGIEWYAAQLPGYWQQWTDVSGVLPFHRSLGNEFAVEFKFLPNPYANHAVFQGFGGAPGTRHWREAL
jgi:hypothetical protein